MTVSRVAPAAAPNTPKKEAALNAPAHEPAAARALIPIEHLERMSVVRTQHPEASFVAHLIATAELMPQTRAFRRATPAAAQAIYDRATSKRAESYGGVLSQII